MLAFCQQFVYLHLSFLGKGQEYWGEENITEDMPACRQMFNIFHPFDPVAYRYVLVLISILLVLYVCVSQSHTDIPSFERLLLDPIIDTFLLSP